jgi:hypothetical protein
MVLPVQGRDKRCFFNQVSERLLVCLGVAAAVVGYSMAGWLGTLIALGVGLTSCARFLTRNRYWRG